jgi:uncharacterized protein YukE
MSAARRVRLVDIDAALGEPFACSSGPPAERPAADEEVGMGMQGADIMQMQQLEQRLQQESGVVKELMMRINQALTNTQWTGPAADRFRQEWTDQFQKALTTLSDALGQNAAAVRNRWQAFEAAAR